MLNLNPEHVDALVKAGPILLPHLIDHHTPKLELFLKPGTEFSLTELGQIHRGLKDWHSFLKKHFPPENNLKKLLLDKNTKLMSQILVFMFRAEKKIGQKFQLKIEDIEKLENFLVSPKDLYLKIKEDLHKEIK